MMEAFGMHRYLQSLAAAVLAAAIAPSSLAAGERSYPALWSGAYVGVHGGYGWADTSIGDGGTVITNPPFGAFACGPALTGNYCNTPFELAPRGWLGGAQFGVNWQSGGLVVGAEADVGWLDISEGRTLFRPFDDRDIASVKYGWYGTLTGRLGYAVNHALLYVKGGAAFADIKVSAADIDLVAGSFEIYRPSLIQQSQVQAGWAIGGGVEYALGRQLSLKAEYLYMDFGSDIARSPDGDIYKFQNELHTVKIGLNYHFSPHWGPMPMK